MSLIVCPNCGVTFDDSTMACPSCGTTVSQIAAYYQMCNAQNGMQYQQNGMQYQQNGIQYQQNGMQYQNNSYNAYPQKTVKQGAKGICVFFAVLLCIVLSIAMIHLINSVALQRIISPSGIKVLMDETSLFDDISASKVINSIEEEFGYDLSDELEDDKEFEKLLNDQYSHVFKYMLTDDVDSALDVDSIMDYLEKHRDILEEEFDEDEVDDKLDNFRDILEEASYSFEKEIKNSIYEDIVTDRETRSIWKIFTSFMSVKNIYISIIIIFILVAGIAALFNKYYYDAMTAVGVTGIVAAILSLTGSVFIKLILSSIKDGDEFIVLFDIFLKSTFTSAGILLVISIIIVVLSGVFRKQARINMLNS